MVKKSTIVFFALSHARLFFFSSFVCINPNLTISHWLIPALYINLRENPKLSLSLHYLPIKNPFFVFWLHTQFQDSSPFPIEDAFCKTIKWFALLSIYNALIPISLGTTNTLLKKKKRIHIIYLAWKRLFFSYQEGLFGREVWVMFFECFWYTCRWKSMLKYV